jgi:hypothetical protein
MEKSPFGAMIGSTFTGVVAYADDIFLLSKSPIGMQSLLDMAFEFSQKWKIRFNPDPGKSDIICFNAGRMKLPRFFLGNDEILITTNLSHLGFIWDTSEKSLLLSHGQARINSFVTQGYNFINRGIQKCHPRTIATIIKVHLFPLLYGMEIGTYQKSQLAIWNRVIKASIKNMFRFSKFCSNKLLDCFEIPNVFEYLDFRRSTMENMIFTNAYTQSILNHRILNSSNSLCKSVEAMNGFKRRKIPTPHGTDGIIDSLRSLVCNWNNFQSQKQFRDMLQYNCPSSQV